MFVTRKPRDLSKSPIDAEAIPLPRLETTPPVTKIYFAITSSVTCDTCHVSLVTCRLSRSGQQLFHALEIIRGIDADGIVHRL